MDKWVSIFIVFIVLILSGCRTSPPMMPFPGPSAGQNLPQRVIVHNHGKHTGISIQASEVNKQLPDLQARFPEARYYEIGWGDRGFYQAEKITTGLTLRAIFWPTPTVLHVVGYDDDPLLYFSGSKNKEVYLSPEGLENMIRFVASSFQKHPERGAAATRSGVYGDSQFYDAEGKYFLFNTCNKWTAKALRSGGQKMGVTFKITSGAVMRDL